MMVLVVDDDEGNRSSIARFLETEGIDTRGAENGHAAQRLLGDDRYDAVILDLRMPGMSGLELLEWLRNEGPRVPVLMVSAFGEVSDAVEAMKLGAADYLVKPVDPDELVLKLRRAVETATLSAAVDTQRHVSGETLGISEAMTAVEVTIARVASTPSTILITGESGTGKEVIARRIHDQSNRAGEPFVPVNLGGMPEALLESELFGHERGSFTGAESRKIGMFEVAGKGTLFLDEVGDMAPPLQVKILRALQDRRIRRLGGTTEVPVAARIIAATNHDLEAAVSTGLFREDLFYRLNVVRIGVPALRERPDDVPYLARELLERANRKLGKNLEAISPDAMRKLTAYPFPGNIRELENVIERAAIFAEGPAIEARDVVLTESRESAQPAVRSLKGVEREAIVVALRRWEGNRTRAAEELGISRRTLLYKIKEYGL